MNLAVSLPLTEPELVFGLLFLAVLVAPLAAERARLPGIIGLIGAGILIGPNSLGLIERSGAVELLGGVGLLYLMFQAGLELDLDDFVEQRGRALIYGMTGFVIPMAIGTAVHLGLGFEVLAAVLLASCWASHTLLAYPALQRLGVVRSPAVAVTVGATIITDTAALLVLAVVARGHQGALDLEFALTLVPSLAAATAAILWGLPRLARWFFAGIGHPRPIRFLFVVVALYASAGIAELAGIEAIVGAFLAGLALNRLVGHGSVLMDQIDFFGTTFLVPVFLISVGMLVDPLVAFTDPASLGQAAAFFGVVVSSKWLAAFATGKGFGFKRSEIGTMFSLSVAQAAATLAAVFVGVQIGLIDEGAVNAVILVILGSSLLASFTAARYGPSLPRPPIRTRPLGRLVLMPVVSPQNAGPLARVAAGLSAADSGTVIPLKVLDLEADSAAVEREHEALSEQAGREVLSGGGDVRPLVRLDVTPATGILHAVVEYNATCVLVGWKGYSTRRQSFFGERVDALLAMSQVPVVLARPGRDERTRRVVLSVTAGDLTPAGFPALEGAALVATRLADHVKVPLVVVTQQEDPALDGLLANVRESRRLKVVVDERKAPIAVRAHSEEGDLVVVGISPLRQGLGQNVPLLARAVPDRTVVAFAPR